MSGEKQKKKTTALKENHCVRVCKDDISVCKSVGVEHKDTIVTEQDQDERKELLFEARLEVDELYSELKTCHLEKTAIEKKNAALSKAHFACVM